MLSAAWRRGDEVKSRCSRVRPAPARIPSLRNPTVRPPLSTDGPRNVQDRGSDRCGTMRNSELLDLAHRYGFTAVVTSDKRGDPASPESKAGWRIILRHLARDFTGKRPGASNPRLASRPCASGGALAETETPPAGAARIDRPTRAPCRGRACISHDAAPEKGVRLHTHPSFIPYFSRAMLRPETPPDRFPEREKRGRLRFCTTTNPPCWTLSIEGH